MYLRPLFVFWGVFAFFTLLNRIVLIITLYLAHEDSNNNNNNS